MYFIEMTLAVNHGNKLFFIVIVIVIVNYLFKMCIDCRRTLYGVQSMFYKLVRTFECFTGYTILIDRNIQWNLSITTTSIIKFIICDLFSKVF